MITVMVIICCLIAVFTAYKYGISNGYEKGHDEAVEKLTGGTIVEISDEFIKGERNITTRKGKQWMLLFLQNEIIDSGVLRVEEVKDGKYKVGIVAIKKQ